MVQLLIDGFIQMKCEGTSTFMANADMVTPGAIRFLWLVLILASCASVAGNVTHAVLVAPEGTVVLAAVAALVAPAVLLAATHTVALLVRARADSGATYWCALLMTLALAGAAFVLSFDALRDLAVTVGVDPRIAWLWPVLIDVSIAQSTTALLSLTRRVAPARVSNTAAPSALGAQSVAVEPLSPAPVLVDQQAPRRSPSVVPARVPAGVNVGAAATAGASDARSSQRGSVGASAAPNVVPLDRLGGGVDARWAELAQRLVDERKTKLSAETVEQVLVLLSRKMSKAHICSQLGVHHTVVRRLQDALDTYLNEHRELAVARG